MKLVFSQDDAGSNSGTSEEVVFQTKIPAVAQTAQLAARVLEIRGFLQGATLDKRIRLRDSGLGGNLYFDSGSDLNNTTGNWLMTIVQRYGSLSTVEMIVEDFYYHKQMSQIIIPSTNSISALYVTSESEAANAVHVEGASWYIVESSLSL